MQRILRIAVPAARSFAATPSWAEESCPDLAADLGLARSIRSLPIETLSVEGLEWSSTDTLWWSLAEVALILCLGLLLAKAMGKARTKLILAITAGIALVHLNGAGLMFYELARLKWLSDDGRFAAAIERVAAIDSLKTTYPTSWLTPWVATSLERVPSAFIGEAVQVASVRRDLEAGSTDSAAETTATMRPKTAIGIQAQQAVQVALAARALRARNLATSVERAEHAYSIRRTAAAHQSLCTVLYHRSVGLVLDGDTQSARVQAERLDRLECSLQAGLTVDLRTFIARAEAVEFLARNPVDSRAAVQSVRRAFDYALSRGSTSLPLKCSMAAVLDVHAAASLAANAPADAVASANESESILPGRALIRDFRVTAYKELGMQSLGKRDWGSAIRSFEGAERIAGQLDSEAQAALGLAHMAEGASLHKRGEFDDAISAYRRAASAGADDPLVRGSLADAYLDRADESLTRADTAGAEVDWELAVAASSAREQAVRMRRRTISDTQARFASFSKAPTWLDVPGGFVSEVPRDLDGDGVAEATVLYGESSTPIAITRLARGRVGPRDLMILDRAGRVTELYRDLDGDGDLDERLDYYDDELSGLIADVDGDRRPDWSISYRNGTKVRDPLSGRILVRVRGAAVRERPDRSFLAQFFGIGHDFITKPDPYVRFFRDGREIGRTAVAWGTYLPTFRESFALNYRHGDVFRFEILDRDEVHTPDELIDFYERSSMPETGVVVMSMRLAVADLIVTPTALDEGTVIVDDSPEVENIFSGGTHSPDVESLVRGAVRDDRNAEIRKKVLNFILSNGVIPGLLGIDDLAKLAIRFGVKATS